MDDVVVAKTRKAWKRLNRFVRSDAVGRSVTDAEGVSYTVYDHDQTVDEEAYVHLHRQTIVGNCHQWQKEWQLLEQDLLAWQQQLAKVPGPDAEYTLTMLLQQREVLLERWHRLAPRADLLRHEFLQPLELPWHQAVTHYRDHRLVTVMQQECWDEPDLARRIDQDLVRQEQRQYNDTLTPGPYWEYYGKFTKALEQERFQRHVAQVTRIDEFHLLFAARNDVRYFTLYIGPTNSGKTFQALRRLATAETGIYLAPLRLLAMEVASTLNEWGVPCNMITGEEKLLVDRANHTASTIEMITFSEQYDLCVIDETQMLGDAERGWAWTQAILGVQAREVCLIGAPECRQVVEKLLQLTGDPYDVVELERLAPLQALRRPVRSLEALEPGTAIIAFSRSAVLGLKNTIERQTRQRVAVLYGSLPPEVRREQARLFASGEAPLLAATDAIGMGLNLPIRTILFAQDHKVIDRKEHPLTPLEVRQIAGRAGRFGFNESGWVGTFALPIEPVRRLLEQKPAAVRKAHLAPGLDHLVAIAGLQQEGAALPRLAQTLALFQQLVRPDPKLFQVANLDDQIVLARITDRFPELDFATRFTLSAAPVAIRSLPVMSVFEQMVVTVASGQVMLPQQALTLIQKYVGQGVNRLNVLETAVKVVNLYCWLHYRFEYSFPDLAGAEQHRDEINQEINRILARSQFSVRLCQQCGRPLPPDLFHERCHECWQARKQSKTTPSQAEPARSHSRSYRSSRRYGTRR
ncbi:MAG: hypothetical protein HQL58_03660 [Magnetococcales bacterium]|nr:hypothetical protein [Magnetococcales bacterium]